MDLAKFKAHLFESVTEKTFEAHALSLFQYQAQTNSIYKRFLDHLGISPDQVNAIREIPFLPISLFKTHQVLGDGQSPVLIFESSGTTGSVRSKHFVADKSLYEDSIIKGFELAYGSPGEYCILALLPSYLERQNASLVHMVEVLMQISGYQNNGFFLDDYELLVERLEENEAMKQPTLLIGVSFALLDLASQYTLNLSNTIVMETGGMKGRGKELTRKELHKNLVQGLGCQVVHSEYGMTELLSQSYAKQDGYFFTPPWMKILVRDPQDSLHYVPDGRTGGLNIIDLANVHSCAFIATQDLGKCHSDGSFEVLGRFDNSDLRGCNLMVS